MTTSPVPDSALDSATRRSWLPLIIIMLAQIQMAFNVTALPVSIGAIVEDFDTSATTVGTALVVYSLFVAAFVMLGAKIGNLVGERLVFQVTVVAHGAAMALMAVSANPTAMFNAQALAGLAAAGLVPSLVVLLAVNYDGKQQVQALGWLAGTPALAFAMSFLVAGVIGTLLSWRYSFGILAVLAACVLLLSFLLKSPARQPHIRIDFVGAVLAAIAIILISFGFNYLNTWGAITARPDAPFRVLGFSPAPFMILAGAITGQGFFAWSHRRRSVGKPPLLALEVLDSPEERNATFAMFIIGALGPAVNFLIPLYMQIVQGYTSMEMAVATVPYTLAIFAAAVSITRLYERLSPRQIGCGGFLIVASGLTLLAFTIGNDWGTPAVILGLIVLGLGEGALLTVLFNVLVSASPKRFAGHVGALRGTANNLSTAVGTAVAALLAVSLLGFYIMGNLVDNPAVPLILKTQIALDQPDFVSNDQLIEVLGETSATAEQVVEAVHINTDARLRALRGTFLLLAGTALLAVVPSLRLPRYHGEGEATESELSVAAEAEPAAVPAQS